MRVLMTGATGLIGSAIASQFPAESLVVLTRSRKRARAQLGDVLAFEWDALRGAAPAESFEDVDAVIHLVGESIGGERWDEERKKRLYDSRIVSTQNLIAGLEASRSKPRVLLSSSAVGYYGSRGDELLDESASPGDDFLARLCVDWESEARRATNLGLRVVNLRTAVVFAEEAPAFQKMIFPYRLGLGGKLGSGKQWMAWVHLDDVVGLTLLALRHESLSGPVNVCAPQPERNRDFAKTVGRILSRPSFLPAPGFALRLVLGEFADAVLASQRAVPRAALDAGYSFVHPTLEEALRAALGNGDGPGAKAR